MPTITMLVGVVSKLLRLNSSHVIQNKMDGSKVIQQLLRPTDTCIIVVQGYLLGLPTPEHRLIAVVKHEGSEEHAMVLFEEDRFDSPPSVKVEAFYPIKGSFSAQMKASQTSRCQVLLHNGQGSSLVLDLPSDGRTAVFISQLNKALHQFNTSSSANSPSAFQWLLGYDKCRTGWDRFSKPHTTDSNSRVNFDPGSGFPESWPWSHIITPNTDGRTEIAHCESLLDDFDPLRQLSTADSTVQAPPPKEITNVELALTKATPEASPTLHKSSSNPFRISTDITNTNPFAPTTFDPSPQTTSNSSSPDPDPKDIRHCISETNLSRLEFESLNHNQELLVSRSQDNLTDMGSEVRHCVAPEEEGGGKEDPLDYKNRRVTRSIESSPSQERKNIRHSLQSFSKRHFEFNSRSGSKALPSHASMDLPEVSTRKKSPPQWSKLTNSGRVRSKSRPPPPSYATKGWVSRYRPGLPVAIPGESARESIMQSELRQREKEFCDPMGIRVFCATWNVNGRDQKETIDDLLLTYEDQDYPHGNLPPDIYAIGFQELDLSTATLLSVGDSEKEDHWVATVEATLRKTNMKYIKLCCVRLVGIMLLVYIKEAYWSHTTDVEVDTVKTGAGGTLGNKGGVGVHFNIYHTSICFVNTHLSAHMEEVEKRNQEFVSVMNKMSFTSHDYTYDIDHHDMIFWLGDLNYRIQTSSQMTTEQVKAHADNYQISTLLSYDQLLQEMKLGNVFLGFTEAAIDFKPTYKYDPNTNDWDSSEKGRAPAWCDRVLYRGEGIQQLTYTSHPKLQISDHKPVSALFDATMRVVVPSKEKEVLEQVTWRLDKLENDTLPQVDLSTLEFKYKAVQFLVPQTKRLVVTNTGHRPVHISFIPKLDDVSICKPWLDTKPLSAVIHPLEDAIFLLTVHIDEDTASLLNSGKDHLEDILVLHLGKGKDFFITISGDYLPSCFGSSLETLVQLHTYIREVPVAQLVDLSSSWEQCTIEHVTNKSQSTAITPPPLDIPKELYALVDHIKRHGSMEESLFTDGGRHSELVAIREMLDTGGREMPGSVFSVAAALLTFLSSLAEPVMPVLLHSRCFDAMNNPTLCRQILTQMSPVHRRTFVFLITFMKTLLEHSFANGLDAKVLAAIFGDVLLRSPLKERKSRSRKSANALQKKKAMFVYQFLTHDLTVTYN